MIFRNQDNEPSLDENGDIFEPMYWLDIKAKPNDEIVDLVMQKIKEQK